MRKKYAAQKGYIDKDIARKQSQLTQAEVKRANLYKLVEKGVLCQVLGFNIIDLDNT